MKILGIVGSPRKDGNSFYLIKEALEAAKEVEPSLETKIIQLADLKIESCRACESCGAKPYKCVNEGDDFGLVLDEMKQADGILRLVNINYLPSKADPEFTFPLKDKPCGLLAVSVEGRQNNLPVLHSLEQYILAYRMRPVHIPNWPWIGVSGKGNEKGDVLNDSEAMGNAGLLGKLLVKEIKV